MAIKRRDTVDGPRYDVQWRLPDRSKRKKTLRPSGKPGGSPPSSSPAAPPEKWWTPAGAESNFDAVYRSWLASRPDLSPKVRRGYEDNWRLRIEPRFADWPIGKIDHESIQLWVNGMSTDGLSPRTVRWTHSVLKMTLDHAVDEGHLLGKNPAARTKFPPMRETTHTYLTAGEVTALAHACGDQGDVVSILAYTGLRFGELTGLNVEDVELDARRIRVRRSITQVGGKLVEGNPKSKAGRRSVPIPQLLVPIFKGRIDGRAPGAPAVASPAWIAAGARELEALGPMADGDRPDRSREDCGCTICGIPMLLYRGGPEQTFAYFRRRWATLRSP